MPSTFVVLWVITTLPARSVTFNCELPLTALYAMFKIPVVGFGDTCNCDISVNPVLHVLLQVLDRVADPQALLAVTLIDPLPVNQFITNCVELPPPL